MAKYYDRCWNPVFGCTGCFAGCDKCYAKSLMERRNRDSSNFTKVQVNRKQLYKSFDEKPQLIAVCTQSDMFQDDFTHGGGDQWGLDAVMSKCNANRQNNYLFLTKFSGNMKDYFGREGLVERLNRNHLEAFSFDNMMFGVSVCTKNDLHRVDDLKHTKNIMHRFVSFEPLLEDIEIEPSMLDGIEWVIAGAQTGDDAGPCRQEWLEKIVDAANKKGIPVFMNAVNTHDGKITSEFDEMDEILRRSDVPFRPR